VRVWPVPLMLSVCGLPVALSVNVMAALRNPLADGVNVIWTLQLAPAPNEVGVEGQLLEVMA
jgi:hypothetical protein